MKMQKDYLANPLNKLDQVSLYPPLERRKLFSIKLENIIEPEQLILIRQLIEQDLNSWTMGFHKKLTRETKTENGAIYRQLGDVTFEKKGEDILITIELFNEEPEQIMIAADGSLKSSITDPETLQQILTKIFQFNKDFAIYSNLIEKTTMSLDDFTQTKRNKPEIPGQELEKYDSATTYEQQMDSLIYEALSSFDEMPEIPNINRQEIFQKAYQSVARDFFDKASKQSQNFFNSFDAKRVLFLKDEDVNTITSAYYEEIKDQSSYAMTLKKGLIVINQELIMEQILDPDFIKIYHLIKRENFSLPSDQKAMIDLLAEYIPFDFNTSNEAIDPNFVDKIKTNENLAKELLEQMLWSIFYHECLHILSSSCGFSSELMEAATYYYTAIATHKEKGTNAFGMSIILARPEPSIKWLTFIRDFAIDKQLAEDMYFNQDGHWSLQKILFFFKDKQEELIKLMKSEDDP